RPQAYVHNPLEWVDPLGLSGCPNAEEADDAILGPHGKLKNDSRPGQSHHLNQDAVFRDVIPTNSGAAIKLEGNAFVHLTIKHINLLSNFGINIDVEGNSVSNVLQTFNILKH
ncbi:hypothetical protein, partial [Shewanella chilikensis]